MERNGKLGGKKNFKCGVCGKIRRVMKKIMEKSGAIQKNTGKS